MPQYEYQNVGTPRFYIDYFQWALVTGLAKNNGVGGNNIFGEDNDGASKLLGAPGGEAPNLSDLEKLFHLDPTNKFQALMPQSTTGDPENPATRRQLTIKTYFDSQEAFNINYCMTLNHNMLNSEITAYIEGYGPENGNNTYASLGNKTEIINYSSDGNTLYNGWSAVENDTSVVNHQSASWWEGIQFNFRSRDLSYSDEIVEIGAISIGTKYTMPHSPDMQLTMEREFGGITRKETKGGSLLTNMTYGHSPLWTSEPWGLYEDLPGNLGARRMGRRVWNLKFSHVADSDLMAQIEMLNFNGVEDSAGYKPYLASEAFLPQFAQKTLNGTLKFIFQPDSTDNSPDGFAICILDQSGIRMTQTSHKTYDINLKIREVW